MYGFTGQSQYGSYNSTYATSPAAAVYSAVQSQQTPHTPTLGAVGATNPTSVYASFSNAAGAAQGASPYAAYAASPSAAAAYAQYGQTAAAVAAVQQQQQVQQLQAATGVVSASAGYGAATRLTDSYSTMGTVPSTGGTYTSLADYTNTLRSAAAAAAASQPTSNSSFVGVTRIGTSQSNPLANSAQSVTGTSSAASNYSGYDAAVYAAASSYLQSKVAGTTNVWMGSGKKMGSGGYGSGNVAYAGSGSTGSGMGRGQAGNRGRFGVGNGASHSFTSSRINLTGTGLGRGHSGPRGRGTFPTKRFGGQSRPAGDVQQFYCEVCKISCAGSQTYKEHIEGQKHKKKEAQQKGEGQTLSKSRVSFRCETCNVTCTGKDTYESHVRGSKHQKTANLMKKLGKPVPEAPTVLAPGEKSNSTSGTQAANGGAPISTVGGPAVPTKRVVGVTKVNFVGGQKLQTGDGASGAADAALEAAGHKNAAVEAALAAEKDVQPVGESYVEEERNAQGKLVQYNCKLCDCKFSDPNAKNIHIKGRKHRLQYKLKVNPELVVDVKPNQVPREMRNELARKMRSHNAPGAIIMPRPFGPIQPLMYPPHHPSAAPRNWFGTMDPGRRVETTEDRHVMAKHRQVYPNDAQLSSVEKLVTMIEKALRGVSDHFANKDGKTEVKAESVAETQSGDKKEGDADKEHHDRLLKGVMRVGLLAKGLLINTDKEVQLVVLCSQPPTRTLLSQVAKLLPEHIKKGDSEIVTVLEKADESALLVKQSDTDIICRIVLSAVMLREDANTTGESGKEVAKPVLPVVKDPLPKGPCLEALAELRHAKWFQARCANLQSAAITLRIIREIRHRVPAWQPLSTWATELFVEKVLASHGAPLSPGDAVRRVFEAIASGVLYSAGPGLKDPCEKDGRDVLAELSGQQREDITAGSQHALRLIAFNQMYKVLNVERLPDPRQPANNNSTTVSPAANASGDRKRPRESASASGAGSAGAKADDGEDVIDVKKGKKDHAKGEDKSIA